MGVYFLMSKKFDKQSPEDFGLISTDQKDIATNPEDGSLWKKCCLYDFGWGRENGFYKLPLPEFDDLMSIVLDSMYDEDMYGAAAVILDMYAMQLLSISERLILGCGDLKKLRKFIIVFRLYEPTNKSPTIGKTTEQISENYKRWRAIAQYINNNSP